MSRRLDKVKIVNFSYWQGVPDYGAILEDSSSRSSTVYDGGGFKTGYQLREVMTADLEEI